MQKNEVPANEALRKEFLRTQNRETLNALASFSEEGYSDLHERLWSALCRAVAKITGDSQGLRLYEGVRLSPSVFSSKATYPAIFESLKISGELLRVAEAEGRVYHFKLRCFMHLRFIGAVYYHSDACGWEVGNFCVSISLSGDSYSHWCFSCRGVVHSGAYFVNVDLRSRPQAK